VNARAFLPALSAAGLLAGWLAAAAVEPKSELRPRLELAPAEAQRAGRALAAKLVAQPPAKNSTNTGVLKIRHPDGKVTEIPIVFKILLTPSNWLNVCEATNPDGSHTTLTIRHTPGRTSEYAVANAAAETTNRPTPTQLAPNATMAPFAGSDFWIADLGLEFLHWPEQNLLDQEMKRGQACDKLESVNPHPAPGGYARVISWVDLDTGGIVHAEAWDAAGTKIKWFEPKKFKQSQGDWRLAAMEIRNLQTETRTRIEFTLEAGTSPSKPDRE
jgi:hypothetical protein